MLSQSIRLFYSAPLGRGIDPSGDFFSYALLQAAAARPPAAGWK
jgi:hypothetical protein